MLNLLETALPIVPIVVVVTVAIGARGGPTLYKYLRGYRHQRARRKLQQKLELRANSPRTFRAVTIVPARPACKLVRRHMQTRYLTNEAPRLPLSGCHVGQCNCRYMHHEDRRVEDRRNPFGIDHVPMGVGDNRREQDRRRYARAYRDAMVAV